MARKKTKSPGTLAGNRKARHDYNIENTIGAGIVPQGTEIKSVRHGSTNLKGSYAQMKHEEMYINNIHVTLYERGNRFNRGPLRSRRLLLHKKEIIKLGERTREIGYSIIPLELYLRHGRCRVLLDIARGEKLHDKRQALKGEAMKRDADRAMKARY